MRESNNFDKIAPLYDYLSGLVFGTSIIASQLHFIDSIPENSNILIIGGGTGWLLPEILKSKPRVKITFIELSAIMIKKAITKIQPGQKDSVTFIKGNILDFLNNSPEAKELTAEHRSERKKQYDVIITNFFLDVFNEKNLHQIMLLIKGVLKTNGQWFCTDFYLPRSKDNKAIWQKVLIFIMYKFFRVVSNLEGNKLLDFDAQFASLELFPVEEAFFFHDMIKTSIFISK